MIIFFCIHFIVNENILQNEKESYIQSDLSLKATLLE